MFTNLSDLFGMSGATGVPGPNMASGGGGSGAPGQTLFGSLSGTAAAPAAVSTPISKDGLAMPEGGFTGFNTEVSSPDKTMLPEGGFARPGSQSVAPAPTAEKPADWNSGWRGGLKGLATNGGGPANSAAGPTNSSLASQAALSQGAHISKFGFTPGHR